MGCCCRVARNIGTIIPWPSQLMRLIGPNQLLSLGIWLDSPHSKQALLPWAAALHCSCLILLHVRHLLVQLKVAGHHLARDVTPRIVPWSHLTPKL